MGFPNSETLLACYNFLNPGVNGVNIVYVNSATEDLEFSASSKVDGSQGNKPGRRRKLSTPDEFFRYTEIMTETNESHLNRFIHVCSNKILNRLVLLCD